MCFSASAGEASSPVEEEDLAFLHNTVRRIFNFDATLLGSRLVCGPIMLAVCFLCTGVQISTS